MRIPRRKVISLCVVILCFFACYGYSENKNDKNYPHGASPILDYNRIEILKGLLKDSSTKWDEVSKLYYGDTYDSGLPNLICYFDSDSSAKIGLVKGNKDSPKLYGDPYVWVLIFYVNGGDTLKKDSLTVTHSVLGHEPEPSENTISGIIKILSKFVVGTALDSGTHKLSFADTSRQVVLYRCLGTRKRDSDTTYSGSTTIYIGHCKFKLQLNTKNRIVVVPDTNHSRLRFITYNFGNFENSGLGAGLGVGVTSFAKLPEVDAVRPYLFGHWYIFRRPQLPQNPWNIGVAVGTNLITETLLHNVIAGARIGYKKTGFVIGGDWAQGIDNVRRMGLFCGFDYRL